MFIKSTKEDKVMLGKTRTLNFLPVALFFAFAMYLMPGLAGDAFAKEAFAEQAFAEHEKTDNKLITLESS